MPVEHACRPLQELDPLDIEQLRNREPDIGITAQSVVEILFLSEPTSSYPGVTEEAHSRDIAIEVLRIARALVLNKFLGDDGYHLAGFERRRRQLARRCFLHAVKLLRPSGDDDHVIEPAAVPRYVLFRGIGIAVLGKQWRSPQCTGEQDELKAAGRNIGHETPLLRIICKGR